MRIGSLALLLACLLALACLAGCGPVATYQTEWFEFTVHSIQAVESYAGHTPGEGFLLYDVLITEKNTFGSAIAMGIRDFYMDDPILAEYIWPLPPLNKTMMPENFYLEAGEIRRYHMVFELPVDAAAPVLLYTELNEDGARGTTFRIPAKA